MHNYPPILLYNFRFFSCTFVSYYYLYCMKLLNRNNIYLNKLNFLNSNQSQQQTLQKTLHLFGRKNLRFLKKFIALIIYDLHDSLYSGKNFNHFMLYFAIKQVEQEKIPTYILSISI